MMDSIIQQLRFHNLTLGSVESLTGELLPIFVYQTQALPRGSKEAGLRINWMRNLNG